MSTEVQTGFMTYTLFPDLSATTKIERADRPWHALVERVRSAASYQTKSQCPLISLGEYGDLRTERGSLRHAANLRRLFGVELDYDGEQVSLQVATARLQNARLTACLYTSPSHRPEAPRWRVLLPLAEPGLPATRSTLVGRVNRVLGGLASRESFTLSQGFFIGRVDGVAYETASTVGRCVDEASDIEPLVSVRHVDTSEVRRDITSDEELRAAFLRGTGRYQAMLKLSSRWAAIGMAEDDIDAALRGLFEGTESLNADGIDLRDRIPGIARSAVRKFGETRAAKEGATEALAKLTEERAGRAVSAGVWSEHDLLEVVVIVSTPIKF